MAKKTPEPKEDGRTIDVIPIEGKVDPKYIPDGFDSVEAFLEDMREQYILDVEFDRLNREAALEDKKFSAGEQWDPIVLEQRKGLPCLVINTIPQFTAQVVGDWRENRKAIKVVPSNDEDVDVAQIRGDIIRSIENNSRADRVYDTAFESLIQCGDGAYRIAVEYARDDVFDQSIFIRPIDDALAVVWDRYSVDPTGRDAKRAYVEDRIPKKEFEAKYGDIAPTALAADDLLDRIALNGWVDSDSYRVTEYWRLVERQRIMGLFENGKIFEISDDQIEDLIQQNGQLVRTRVSWCTYAQMHLCTGFAILSGPFEYRLTRLPIIRMSGRIVNVGGRRIRYGLVRFIKDAVRLKNFWRSVAAEQLGYAPKAKWMATESAVEGREDKIRQAHLSRDPLLIFNDEAQFGANVQQINPPGIEAALFNEANINTQDMKDITGIHDASLGIRSNETSGRAIMARQREGDIANITFHDNGDAAVLEGGDVINQLIPQVMDGTRVERIIGEDETVRFVRLNDPMDPKSIDLSVGKFDVALSTGTSYTTRRVEAAQAMMDAIQVWPQLMTVAGDLVAKAQDWPGADKIAERLAQAMQAGQVDPQQFAQLQQKAQQLTVENLTLKLENKNKADQHNVSVYDAVTKRISALSDNQVDGNTMEMQALQILLEHANNLDEQNMRQDEFTRNEQLQQSTLDAQREAAAQKQSQTGTANG